MLPCPWYFHAHKMHCKTASVSRGMIEESYTSAIFIFFLYFLIFLLSVALCFVLFCFFSDLWARNRYSSLASDFFILVYWDEQRSLFFPAVTPVSQQLYPAFGHDVDNNYLIWAIYIRTMFRIPRHKNSADIIPSCNFWHALKGVTLSKNTLQISLNLLNLFSLL